MMFDFFIGKPPSTNRQMEKDPSPVQKTVRELLRVARILKSDRRKNTEDRRRESYDDVVVHLSNQQERRNRQDRRQRMNRELQKEGKLINRRRSRRDRRRLVNQGIIVTLKSKRDRRSGYDRRNLL